VKSENSAPVDSRDSGRYLSAAEWFEKQRRLVMLVTAAYRAVQTLSPVIASNLARTEPNPNKWSPTSCHFKCDVELAVRRVIEAKPENERPALWRAWSNLLSDEEGKLGKDEQRLIRHLSGPMFTKKLHPGLYFAPRRLTSKDRSR
jgi:hypothetical protein